VRPIALSCVPSVSLNISIIATGAVEGKEIHIPRLVNRAFKIRQFALMYQYQSFMCPHSAEPVPSRCPTLVWRVGGTGEYNEGDFLSLVER
jgi:hypothetical protein